MAPEVTAAMVEASKHFVCLEELQFAAGSYIAQLTGAEAAYVTSGAQAGLVLSIAACITGASNPGNTSTSPCSKVT